MSNLYHTRTFVSFSGKCPLNCKHCYSFEVENNTGSSKSVSEIVNSMAHKDFDIIYISQKNENFFNEIDGIDLCDKLYQKYKKDILIITRSHLSDVAIEKLENINDRMKLTGNQLFLSTSICGGPTAFEVTERLEVCPTPNQRLENLRRAHNKNIRTLLTIRPVFPNSVIPIAEVIQLLNKSYHYLDAVVSSGLIATDAILRKLELKKQDFSYLPDGDSEYLSDLQDVSLYYFDVKRELQIIEKCCFTHGVPFFLHSMPALNHLASLQ